MYNIFKDILKNYDPELESMGLDEANLDLTNYLQENNIQNFEKIEDLCKKIRNEVNEATKITCSCGIASNKMLAKMCSEINKPNGQFLLKNTREEILEFMSKKPIRKIPGIGSVNEQLLIGLGVHNCEDILSKKKEIKICFTENSFEFFIKAALGIARCFHEKSEERKSISVSRTFPTIASFKDMENKLRELAESIADDLEYFGKMAKHITVNAKTHKFEVKSKNLVLDKFIKSKEEIFTNSCILLKQLWPLDPVRLLGIKLSELISEETLKSQGIEKYFAKNNNNNNINPEKNEIKDEDDELLLDEIDRILNNDYSKKSLESNSNNGDNSNLQCLETKNKFFSSENDQRKETRREKTLKNNIPQVFRCFICNLDIECGGNSIRMNNHIDKCLASLNKTEENILSSAGNNDFKRKQSAKSPEIIKSGKKNAKTKKTKINSIPSNTLENFFQKKSGK